MQLVAWTQEWLAEIWRIKPVKGIENAFLIPFNVVQCNTCFADILLVLVVQLDLKEEHGLHIDLE